MQVRPLGLGNGYTIYERALFSSSAFRCGRPVLLLGAVIMRGGAHIVREMYASPESTRAACWGAAYHQRMRIIFGERHLHASTAEK